VQRKSACVNFRAIMLGLQVLQQRPFFNSTDLPSGYIFNPLARTLGTLPSSPVSPPQCPHCGGYANCFTEYTFASSGWRCNFCAADNTSDEPLRQDAPHVQHRDFDQLMSAGAVAEASGAVWPSTVFLLVDASLDEDLLAEVVDASKALLQRLPPTAHVALIALSSCVSIFDLGSSDADAAHVARAIVAPGPERPSEAMLARLRASCTAAVAPVQACWDRACAALDSLRPYHHAQASRQRPRCVGAAFEAALLLHAATKSSTHGRALGGARVVAMLGGPATVGPGSVSARVLDGAGTSADQFAKVEAEQFVGDLAERMAAAGTPATSVPGCYSIWQANCRAAQAARAATWSCLDRFAFEYLQ
jgi:Sec23/Sec24 trunk domain/Sec23/Sec24 zinc finger